MTIFHLAIFVCSTIVMPLTGDLMSKTCQWRDETFWMTRQACEAAGAGDVGKTVWGDSMIIGEERKIEKFSCREVPVQK